MNLTATRKQPDKNVCVRAQCARISGSAVPAISAPGPTGQKVTPAVRWQCATIPSFNNESVRWVPTLLCAKWLRIFIIRVDFYICRKRFIGFVKYYVLLKKGG